MTACANKLVVGGVGPRSSAAFQTSFVVPDLLSKDRVRGEDDGQQKKRSGRASVKSPYLLFLLDHCDFVCS